jgi:hypothetical protein
MGIFNLNRRFLSPGWRYCGAALQLEKIDRIPAAGGCPSQVSLFLSRQIADSSGLRPFFPKFINDFMIRI